MRAVALLTAALVVPHCLPAQEQPIHRVARHPTWQAAAPDPASSHTAQPPLAAPILGGISGGLAGILMLGWAGYALGGGSEICGDDPCGLAGGVYGALLGEIVGVAAGAHVGNARRGSVGFDLAASLATLLAVGTLGSMAARAEVTVPLTLIAQLAATVAAERLTTPVPGH